MSHLEFALLWVLIPAGAICWTVLIVGAWAAVLWWRGGK